MIAEFNGEEFVSSPEFETCALARGYEIAKIGEYEFKVSQGSDDMAD